MQAGAQAREGCWQAGLPKAAAAAPVLFQMPCLPLQMCCTPTAGVAAALLLPPSPLLLQLGARREARPPPLYTPRWRLQQGQATPT